MEDPKDKFRENTAMLSGRFRNSRFATTSKLWDPLKTYITLKVPMKWNLCVRVVPPFEQSFYRRLLNSGDPLQWRCLNKDLVVVLSNLHTNRNKLKGSEDFNWNNTGLVTLRFLCDFSGTHDFGWWFLADLLSGHVSTTTLMRKCDSNIGKFVSTELL